MKRFEDSPRCSACGGVYHEATGHAFSPTTRLCGPCARNMVAWVKKHVSKRWSKGDFYAAAATSVWGPTPGKTGKR